MTREIPLGSLYLTLVDDDDYDRLRVYEWFLSGTGYAVAFIPVDGQFKLTYLHRLLMDAQPGDIVDHINSDPLDNRRDNLRIVTPQQNSQNKRLSAHSTTRLKGVGWHKRRHKYHARIQLQGIRYHLGFFNDLQEAAQAYDEAARWLFKEFAVWQLSRQRDSTICGPSGGSATEEAGISGQMKVLS